MTYKIIRTNELYHHGIKGQKYGVRRFQNKDGSLTSAGEARYLLQRGDKTSREAAEKKAKEEAELNGVSEDKSTKKKSITIEDKTSSTPKTKELEVDDLKKIFGDQFEDVKSKVAAKLAEKGPGATELTKEEVAEILGKDTETIHEEVKKTLANKEKAYNEAQEKSKAKAKSSRKKTSNKKSKDTTKENSKSKEEKELEEISKKVDRLEKEEETAWNYAQKGGSQANQEHRIAMAKLNNAIKEENEKKKKIKHSAIVIRKDALTHSYNGFSYKLNGR